MSGGRSLGILVVHNDPVPETEIPRAIGERGAVITARFKLNRRPGEEYRGESVEEFLTPQMQESIGWLVDAGADAVALCFTSASMMGPPGFDDDFAEAIEAIHGVPGFTAGMALRRELESAAPRAVLLLIPPWFTDTTVQHATAYLRAAIGGARESVHRYQLAPDWDTSSRQDLFDRGAKARIAPADLINQIEAHAPADADLTIVPGSGFATLDALAGRAPHLPPLLTANGAVARHFLSDLTGPQGDKGEDA